jgi:hypothetical protein
VTVDPPPHYTAFRLVLAAVAVATLGVAVWWVLTPAVLALILDFLGLR